MKRIRDSELTRNKILEYCKWTLRHCPKLNEYRYNSVPIANVYRCYKTCPVKQVCYPFSSDPKPDAVITAMGKAKYCLLRSMITKRYNIASTYIRQWCKSALWTGVANEVK